MEWAADPKHLTCYLSARTEDQDFPADIGLSRGEASESLYYILSSKMEAVTKATTLLRHLHDHQGQKTNCGLEAWRQLYYEFGKC